MTSSVSFYRPKPNRANLDECFFKLTQCQEADIEVLCFKIASIIWSRLGPHGRFESFKKTFELSEKKPQEYAVLLHEKKAASVSQKKTFSQEKLEELARKTSLISVFKKKFENPIAFISHGLTVDLFTTYPKSILKEIEEEFGEKFSKKDLPIPSFGFHLSLNQERIEEEKPSFNFQLTSNSTIFLEETIEL